MAPPTPTNPHVTNQLRQLIYYHLDNNLLQNALFMAERLAAYDSHSADGSHLLALCYHRLGDDRSAYEYSKSPQGRWNHLGCAYIFALACLSLCRWKDGIAALEKSRGVWGGRNTFGKHSQQTRQCLPDAAAVNGVLGKLYQGLGDTKRAVSYFEEALKLNPFMWNSFTGLCDMGIKIQITNIFKMSPEMEALMKQTNGENVLGARDTSENAQNRSRGASNEVPDPFNVPPSKSFASGLFGSLGLSQKLNESNPSISNINVGGLGTDPMETPTGPGSSIDHNILVSNRNPSVVTAYPLEPPQAPARRHRTQGLGMEFSLDAPPKMSRGISRKQKFTTSSTSNSTESESLAPIAGERKRTVSGQVVQPRERQTSEDPAAPSQRRSARLFSQMKPSRSSGTTSSVGPPPARELKKARPPISRMMRPTPSISTVGRVVSGNRKVMHSDDHMDIDSKETYRAQYIPIPAIKLEQKPVIKSESAEQEDAVRWLLNLFRRMGFGYSCLAMFKCQDALTHFAALEKSQQDTPWVLALQGKAYFEMAQYAEAEPYYKRIRIIAPTRFEDMEIYSTILWHLKQETDLAFLAHELIDSDWSSPYAWCALGNSWSLARDHESALKCFKRATQLNPDFAYAHTLQGHEHVANEEFDKALAAYRHGIKAESRHYNAWYGVGRVQERLGKWDQALKHYTQAANINPTNAVLTFCIGAVHEKRKDLKTALMYFTQACLMNPKNSLARYKKARVMMHLGDMVGALTELLELKQQAPDEGMVWFLLGKLYRSMAAIARGEAERGKCRGEAVRCFTVALNLDPKV